ncbi:MAG: hypothetical protein BWY86_00137 [Candidatus Aminicenantes bacterium ADurb.Bin508]|nr:MAG: hypothetical protein BWY86_00137 [Candidatus Aminicenantes bacterium ADurb.Bin508]
MTNSLGVIHSVTTAEAKRELNMAMKLAKIVITGNMISPAMTRGRTRNPIGSRDIVSKASTCSEIFILPISAAREAPSLPANTRARMMGQSSTTAVLKMALTTTYRGTMSVVWYFPWTVEPRPTKTAITAAMGSVLTEKL